MISVHTIFFIFIVDSTIPFLTSLLILSDHLNDPTVYAIDYRCVNQGELFALATELLGFQRLEDSYLFSEPLRSPGLSIG